MEWQCKLRSLAILTWGLARLCLEKADEVLRIFKAEALAYLRYAEGFIIKQLAGAESNRSLIILLAVLPVSVLTNSPKYLLE